MTPPCPREPAPPDTPDTLDAPDTGPTPGLAVTLRGVQRVFPGGVAALAPIDLVVPPGQFLAILGPSGCGKSTLLRLVAGLDRPTVGQAHVEADTTPRPSPDRRAKAAAEGALAFVFQDAHLLPWRTVLANVALPLELAGVPKDERLAAAGDAIAQVGLEEAAARYPAQLSGGMRMRASLARALVTRPRLLLLDEPFAALDEITRQGLDDQLRRLWRARRMTVLFVTHSIGEATFLAERAVVLSRRPGRVVADHPIALPPERDLALRTDPAFAGQTRVLYDALVRGGSFA